MKKLFVALSVLCFACAAALLWLWCWMEHLTAPGQAWWGGPAMLFTIFALLAAAVASAVEASK